MKEKRAKLFFPLNNVDFHEHIGKAFSIEKVFFFVCKIASAIKF